MSRPAKVLISTAVIAVVAFATGCGTEKITASSSDPAVYQGATLFAQRCSGCHTLSYAATHGSAANVRTRLITNGPNFNTRCERPVTRVLYAIENGGFSGAIMPQNVVVGQQAQEVAKFVATYAGRQAPKIPGVMLCTHEPIGSLPSGSASSSSSTSSASSSSSGGSGKGKAAKKKPAGGKTTTHP